MKVAINGHPTPSTPSPASGLWAQFPVPGVGRLAQAQQSVGRASSVHRCPAYPSSVCVPSHRASCRLLQGHSLANVSSGAAHHTAQGLGRASCLHVGLSWRSCYKCPPNCLPLFPRL